MKSQSAEKREPSAGSIKKNKMNELYRQKNPRRQSRRKKFKEINDPTKLASVVWMKNSTVDSWPLGIRSPLCCGEI